MTQSPWQLNEADLTLIDLALTEDLGVPNNDVTTAALFPDFKGISTARIISKHPEPIIICGLPIVQAILAKSSTQTKLITTYQDGDSLPPQATLATITGPAHILLKIERVLLNFLQHLCGVASFTQQFVQQIQHTHTRILDTRKTLPGWRHLDKYAVRCGGGVNHRMGLYDAIMIKDTHVDLLGGMEKALTQLSSSMTRQLPIIVEVRTVAELTAVITHGRHKVTRILLDNMSPTLMRECVIQCQHIFPTEASGGISLANVAAVADTGVDFISIGQLTHSAKAVDLSMQCEINNA